QNAERILDDAYHRLLENSVTVALNDLFRDLNALRCALPQPEWMRFATTQCIQHPLLDLLLQDPITRHSYTKPRGYDGDADLLDLIYGTVEIPSETTDLGMNIYYYMRDAPASRSVRWRRDHLAKVIDTMADQVSPRILSIACGHLREGQISQALP